MTLVARFFWPFGKRRPENTSPIYVEVRDALSDVQAYARSHGGQIHLVDVTDDGLVKIKLTGTCNGCPMSDVTLKLGVERQLRELVPAVRQVVQVR
jgi:Fe-S cluster biogenesis protein NfuA